MANRLFNPDITFVDATGLPYAGGQLFFYASGTSTKLNTYSDAGLTVANTNPIILDSAGRAGAIFLQNLQYKVVLAPANDTDPPTAPIWTQDPVYTSDYSAAAQFSSGSGSPNGVVAGNAGTATILASSYWDFTNNILYICTATGTASTAIWTAINASTAAAVVTPPQGYLTPESGTPVIVSDSISATTIYYTPYTGLLVPIYNGVSFTPVSIVTELSYTLTSSMVANNIYDCYIFSNNGVATLGTGPSWSAGTAGSITAGSCARGSGAGGAALARLGGLLTNAVSMTLRYGNGTTTASVDAGKATYVGSLYIDDANGKVSNYVTYGQSRKRGLWNAFNRVPIILTAGDSTSSWTYNSATLRPSNNNTANSITVFSGLAEETYNLSFLQKINGNSITIVNAIGYNSTSASSGYKSSFVGGSITASGNANYVAPPSLGINTVTSLEGVSGGTATYYGGASNMELSAIWRG